jgi:hypothetical protein
MQSNFASKRLRTVYLQYPIRPDRSTGLHLAVSAQIRSVLPQPAAFWLMTGLGHPAESDGTGY